MTREEFENLIPRKSMVYRKSDGVGYTFMGRDTDGDCILYGMPSYPENIIIECFDIEYPYK